MSHLFLALQQRNNKIYVILPTACTHFYWITTNNEAIPREVKKFMKKGLISSDSF